MGNGVGAQQPARPWVATGIELLRPYDNDESHRTTARDGALVW